MLLDPKRLKDPAPLRVMFCLTSMPVGGAELLLVNLIRRLDRQRFSPEVCCLKERGPLGDQLADEIPVHAELIRGKYDVRVLARLANLFRRVDAVVTVGAGDKMFWGRLAARAAGVPVVASALHSTGWPDGVGRLNRLLTPLTDAFIAVAGDHGRFLVEQERFPQSKVCVIPNGVDVERFRPRLSERRELRRRLGLDPYAPVVGIVAALRPEKNHLLFLRAASKTRHLVPEVQFAIVGDGPERERLARVVKTDRLTRHVHFLGTRNDIPDVLGAFDVFSLTSHNEANPVSILEAMAVGLPVVATRVGSVVETVEPDETGFLVEPGQADALADCWTTLLEDPTLARGLGATARERVVDRWSLDRMVRGYEELIESIYRRRCPLAPRG